MIESEGGETMKKSRFVLVVLSVLLISGGAMMTSKIFKYGFNSNKQPEISIIDTRDHFDNVALDFGNGKQPEIIELSNDNGSNSLNERQSKINLDTKL